MKTYFELVEGLKVEQEQEKNLEKLKKDLSKEARKADVREEDIEEAAVRRKRAPKMTGDSVAIQRAKDAALNKALGRTKTGRKKPVRTMTSTQKSLASLRREEVELDEAMDQKKFSSGARAMKAYAQKYGGVDKKDFMEVSKLLDQIGRVNILQAGQLLSRLNRLVDGMDTDVRERIFVELKKVGLVESANESLDEVLDRPGALDSYRKKAKMKSDKARNTATAKLVRGNPNISKEKETIRKREKGQDMADRVGVKQFRKSIGRGYLKNNDD